MGQKIHQYMLMWFSFLFPICLRYQWWAQMTTFPSPSSLQCSPVSTCLPETAAQAELTTTCLLECIMLSFPLCFCLGERRGDWGTFNLFFCSTNCSWPTTPQRRKHQGLTGLSGINNVSGFLLATSYNSPPLFLWKGQTLVDTYLPKRPTTHLLRWSGACEYIWLRGIGRKCIFLGTVSQ